MNHVFGYFVRFPPFGNPSDRKDQFDASLHEFFKRCGVEYGMCALGGMASTYGDVWTENGERSADCRERLQAWIARQPVRCAVSLSRVVGFTAGEWPLLDDLRNQAAVEFQVDNLSDADRAEVARLAERIRRRVRDLQNRRDG